MGKTRPPARLPAGYTPIWQALESASRRGASRQAFARSLGVSTATLQRILVDGDVPAFPRTKNRRIRHAWARTLARLALRLGHDPAAWIRGVGIPWDPSVEGIVEAARPARKGSAARPAGRPVRIAVVERGPLGESLLEELTRRLVIALDPGAELQFEPMSEGEAARRLARGGSDLDLAAGVWDTARRRAQGVSVIALPGWSVPLQAVAVVPPEGPPVVAWTWEAVTAAEGDLACDLLSLRDAPAHAFLRGSCRIPAARLELLEGVDSSAIAAEMLGRAGKSGARAVVFVGDAGSCRELFDALQGAPAASGWRTLSIEPPRERAVRFGFGIACGTDARDRWEEGLATALRSDFFGAAARESGALYASAVLAQVGSSAGAQALLAPAPFALASPPFVEGYLERLLESLEPAEIVAFLPREWRPDLVRVAEKRHVANRIVPFCHSCSASLRDPHNLGLSDRYCRFCSDESGHLRSRDEVRKILAGWMEHWQGGLTPEQAMRRADSLMQAMPAWSTN